MNNYIAGNSCGLALIISASRWLAGSRKRSACSTFAVSRSHRLVPPKSLERQADGLCMRPPSSRERRSTAQSNGTAPNQLNVACYANCQEVTLTLNGKVIGTKRRSEALTGIELAGSLRAGTLKRWPHRRTGGCHYVLQTPARPAGLTAAGQDSLRAQ